MRKNEQTVEPTPPKTALRLPEGLVEKDELKTDIAIGTLTFFTTALLLFVLNFIVFNSYQPDIGVILNKIIPLSFAAKEWFRPEPVERLQFMLSVVLTPFFIYGSYLLIYRKRNFFFEKPLLCTSISLSGLLIIALYAGYVLSQELVIIPRESNAYFFNNNLISILNPFLAILVYLILGVLVYLYYRKGGHALTTRITSILLYCVAGFCIFDVVLFDIFHLANSSIGALGETNAVFYAITQVYAGKSLLVDINCQYGLYAWILLPVFKIIGLSTFKLGMVMALLNGASFLLLYLGIKKIIKQDLLSFLVFLCLIFWQFWQTRLPFEPTARFYYQYNPIRTLFPSIAFYLVVLFVTGPANIRRTLVPVLALVSSLAIFWNLDTGLVVFGATLIALVISTLDQATWKDSVSKSLAYAGWMVAALLFIIVLFFLSTKIRSGSWPDLRHFSDFQQVFYISGFFMLPMTAVHFWNFPVIMYLVAGVYCASKLRKTYTEDLPVISFLFALGIGLFAYFQGRSYDTTIDIVMYPAIIIAGIFCSRLFPLLTAQKTPRVHESTVLFLVLFLILADGATSMIYSAPTIHTYAWNNAFTPDEEKEEKLAQRLDFLRANLKEKDTVLILAKNYESFYYATGQYYNPLNLPGSTELIFKTEIDQLLEMIRTTKYPIICDARYYWPNMDTIVQTLSKYTTIEKFLPSDFTLVLLKPGKKPVPDKLAEDGNMLYYSDLGDFNKYLNQNSHLSLPDNFTVEFIARLDSARLVKDDIVFCTLTQNSPYSGILMKQEGDDLTHFAFGYGNGSEWCKGVDFKMSCGVDNHIIIQVRKNIISGSNNGQPFETANTNSSIKNSNGVFYINPHFSGTIDEIKISNQ